MRERGEFREQEEDGIKKQKAPATVCECEEQEQYGIEIIIMIYMESFCTYFCK